jgi:hypothetical protein
MSNKYRETNYPPSSGEDFLDIIATSISKPGFYSLTINKDKSICVKTYEDPTKELESVVDAVEVLRHIEDVRPYRIKGSGRDAAIGMLTECSIRGMSAQAWVIPSLDYFWSWIGLDLVERHKYRTTFDNYDSPIFLGLPVVVDESIDSRVCLLGGVTNHISTDTSLVCWVYEGK